jgi:ech hydrogenase subunit E
MGKRSVIPFGPQHPVLPEPIHLDLVLEDEKVIEAIPSIGFIHRGLEKLVEKKDFIDYVYVAERICGICSFTHGMGYCNTVENIMGIKVPDRAEYLRVIWAELARVHSHLLWLGLTADAFGFESLFMQCWRIREKVLDILEMTTGGRVIFSVCKVGGVRRDVDSDTFTTIIRIMDEILNETREAAKVFLNDHSVRHRLCGVGVLTKQQVHDLGAVGPVLRASGVGYDARLLGYSVYNELSFEPVVETDGDCYARCVLRIKEIYQSVSLVKEAISKMPDGEIAVKVTGNPDGDYFGRFEQPRGEVIYYIKANGTKFLERFRARTPTFANLPALMKMLEGAELADVPVMVLTIDPCISCTER